MKTLLKLFSLKLLTSLFGLLYSILQVRYFGVSRAIEVYFAAQTLVYLITSLTQSGHLAEVFLPEYHKLEIKNKGFGFKGLNIVINRMFLFGTLILSLVFVFTPFFVDLIVPGFSTEDKSQVSLMFRILIPIIYIQILNSFFITILNAEKKFGKAEFIGMTNTIINILCLLLLFNYMGVWALVLSLLLGKIIEFVFYIISLNKIGYRYNLILSMPEFDHNTFFKVMGSTFMYVGATQVYTIVLTASISFLPTGSLAIFKYVENLGNRIKSLFLQPFITIFFTAYSSQISHKSALKTLYLRTLKNITSVNVIIFSGSLLVGKIIIDIIWGGEKFLQKEVDIAFIFLCFNMVGVFISSTGALFRKIVVSEGKSKTLYQYWVFSQLLCAATIYILVKSLGINGLYLAKPINAFLIAIVSYIIYRLGSNYTPIKYLTKSNLYSILLITVSFSLMMVLNDYETNNMISDVALRGCLVLLLSIFPLFSIFSNFKENDFKF